MPPDTDPPAGPVDMGGMSRSRRSALGQFVHEIDDELHVVGRSFRKDAVAEIEDMTRSRARPREHLPYVMLEHIPRRQQQDRIEVALKRDLRPESCPGEIERSTPVNADHAAPGLALQFE